MRAHTQNRVAEIHKPGIHKPRSDPMCFLCFFFRLGVNACAFLCAIPSPPEAMQQRPSLSSFFFLFFLFLEAMWQRLSVSSFVVVFVVFLFLSTLLVGCTFLFCSLSFFCKYFRFDISGGD